MTNTLNRQRRFSARAFTLIEAVVAMLVVGILIVALYSGITWAWFALQMARDNLRATQILTEQMELIRVNIWDQIISNNVIKSTFQVPYDGKNTNAGMQYFGTITIQAAPTDLTYHEKMRLVTVDLAWETRGLKRSRQLSTYISQHGLHKYFF